MIQKILRVFIVTIRSWFFSLRGMLKYSSDLITFSALPKNKAFQFSPTTLYPCIYDNTLNTPVEPIYLLQNMWTAQKIFRAKPPDHYDIGSSLQLISILSQYCPVTMTDIRPPAFSIPNLRFIQGSILKLPYKDNSLPSLSSICVIEHIGLGRYGDPLDPYGSEKAVSELIRVLKSTGTLYITVPVDAKSRIYFNAHRTFTRSYILKLFKSLTLVDEIYIYGTTIEDTYRPEKGFGTGLYHFQKR